MYVYIHIYILLHVCALCLSIYSGSGPIFFGQDILARKPRGKSVLFYNVVCSMYFLVPQHMIVYPTKTGQAKDSPEEHFHDVWRNWGSANGQAGRRTREDQTGKELRCVHNHLFGHPSSWLDLASSSLIHMRSKLWHKKMLREYRLVLSTPL